MDVQKTGTPDVQWTSKRRPMDVQAGSLWRLPGPAFRSQPHAIPAPRCFVWLGKQRHRLLPIRAVAVQDARHIHLPADERPAPALRVPVQSHLEDVASARCRLRLCALAPRRGVSRRQPAIHAQRDRGASWSIGVKEGKSAEPVAHGSVDGREPTAPMPLGSGTNRAGLSWGRLRDIQSTTVEDPIHGSPHGARSAARFDKAEFMQRTQPLHQYHNACKMKSFRMHSSALQAGRHRCRFSMCSYNRRRKSEPTRSLSASQTPSFSGSTNSSKC